MYLKSSLPLSLLVLILWSCGVAAKAHIEDLIVDEAQNVTHSQMETVIGRLGKNSKMVICGDIAQIDLKNKKESGFTFLYRLEENVEGFKTISLETNHRHEIVAPILEVYKLFRD